MFRSFFTIFDRRYFAKFISQPIEIYLGRVTFLLEKLTISLYKTKENWFTHVVNVHISREFFMILAMM